ncbi:MAG TPA: PP2C family protein-serine/threonine phosphatase [Spirochaetota bacterium]
MDNSSSRSDNSVDEIVRQYHILDMEAETVRRKDRGVIRGLFGNFYGKQLTVGIGFQRAYGSVLSGDYFELVKLPDENYLFVFADISGHGLPAYTTLIRLRSAITLGVKESARMVAENGFLNPEELVRDIGTKFTDIMEAAESQDFASVIYTYIRTENDKFYLRFFNRGMYFPIVVRKFRDKIVDLYDLNIEEKGWFPQKGGLLGYEFRDIRGDQYDVYPSCEFIVYEGDCVFFFSDGIVEARKSGGARDEFGFDRMKRNLFDHLSLFPQAAINHLFEEVYEFMGELSRQEDDMTAVLIDFPLVR